MTTVKRHAVKETIQAHRQNLSRLTGSKQLEYVGLQTKAYKISTKVKIINTTST
jgi:hypothetical protein